MTKHGKPHTVNQTSSFNYLRMGVGQHMSACIFDVGVA